MILSHHKPRAGLLALPAFILLICISSTASSEPPMARVEGLRHWSGPNTTRIVIDLDRKAEYTYRLLKEDPSINKPGRLYVDIKGARLAPGAPRSVPVHDGHLRGVRAGQYESDTVRVVLDIESIDDYEVFQLLGPARIVIDVAGAGSKQARREAAARVTEAPSPAAGPSGDEKTRPAAPKPDTPARAAAQPAYTIDTIVIDAGHGGKDPGAVGKNGLREKDVTLKIAKLLSDDLKKRLNAKVILTRSKDVYISLDERTAIAKTREADLFISIHVNASPRREASGVETYYLDVNATDKAALRLAARENAATANDKNSDILNYILTDMKVNMNQTESSDLASRVQESLSTKLKNNYSGVRSNGVKGGPFYVLVNCDMPSILVEVSFISNPTEEKRLRSGRYLEDITRGISDGVVRFVSGEKV